MVIFYRKIFKTKISYGYQLVIRAMRQFTNESIHEVVRKTILIFGILFKTIHASRILTRGTSCHLCQMLSYYLGKKP